MTAMVLLSEWQRSQVEFWRPIQGFDGYDVSSFGRVRTFKAAGRRWTQPRLILAATVSNWGYSRLSIIRNDGKRKSMRVHRLVAIAFLPNPQNLEQVNHKNAVKVDNRLDNLEHASRSRNIKHAYDNGLLVAKQGEKNAWAKLTDEAVREILRRGHQKKRQGSRLAREYGVDKSVVNKILRGVAWRHLQAGG